MAAGTGAGTGETTSMASRNSRGGTASGVSSSAQLKNWSVASPDHAWLHPGCWPGVICNRLVQLELNSSPELLGCVVDSWIHNTVAAAAVAVAAAAAGSIDTVRERAAYHLIWHCGCRIVS